MKTIVMSEDELNRIIHDAVSRATRVQQKTLFSPVSITKQDFSSENIRHKISNIEFHVCDINGNKMWLDQLDGPYSPLPRVNGAGETTHQDIRSDVVHDLVRKLTLSVYGVRKNKDMRLEDYQRAMKEYQAFANLYFTFYKRRLDELDKEG